MKKVWVVYTDANPVNVVAFFLIETDAQLFKTEHYPAADVRAAEIATPYFLVDTPVSIGV